MDPVVTHRADKSASSALHFKECCPLLDDIQLV